MFAVRTRTREAMTVFNFLDHLDTSYSTDQQTTTPPFPGEEFAAMLPSNILQGGHTAPLHPEQETLTNENCST